MTREQWSLIRQCALGQPVAPTPVALIVDSPWIPGYLGLSTLDYLTVPDVWLAANLRVVREFPEIAFLPGFWMEIGMTAEPSGFGCKASYFADRPPAVHPMVSSIADAARLPSPDPTTDGLMPIVLNYYRRVEPQVSAAGHPIKMVAARGPLTVATHVMGVSEFLLAMKLEPKWTHQFLATTTTLTRTWLAAQADALKEVEGILVLDDIAGFMSAKDYREFAHPYLKEVFDAFPGAVKMFHNDTNNPVSYPHLRELGIHIFNFTHLQPLARVRELVGPDLCLLGNVPPLEVLTQGSPEQVVASARACLSTHPSGKGLILSAGGGASPGTPGANLHALARAVQPEAVP
jgi:uroporphyrinogen decarboxylase